MPCKMYPIHNSYSYSVGARPDIHSLYRVINRYPRDVSIAKWLIEKGEFKYSTDGNELFVLTCFMFKC